MRAALVFLVLCALATPGTLRPLSAQAPTFPSLALEAAVGEGVVRSCTPPGAAGGVKCGVFRVDEDGEQGGRTLDLHFVIMEALQPDSAAPDPVFVFNGGPGVGAIPARLDGDGPMREVRRTRDVLLVDLRGIGHSNGLNCDVPHPRGVASRFGSLFALDQIEQCRELLAERAELEHYTTAATVDDLEALRIWLAYPSVNLYGGSYGTRVAQVYMRRHPEAVRTAVLNGVTAVADPTYVQTSRNLQDALDHLVVECEEQRECSAAFPAFRQSLDALLERFADGPVEVRAMERTVSFTAGDLSYALRGLLYGRASDIPYFVDRARDGNLDELVAYYLERTSWVTGTWNWTGNHLSVICAEDIDRVTDEDVERATLGTFMGDYLIRSYREACALWPNADLPPSEFEPVKSTTPTLLLSGGRDPATPPSGGDRVAEHLSRSLHVVVPNGGHGVRGECVTAMVVRLIEDGSLDRVDSSCIASAPPLVFRLPSEELPPR